MTNAKKNECRQGIIERAERHWGNALGMTRDEVREKQLVYRCNRDKDGNPRPNGYTLTRGTGNYAETRSKMIGQMSYLTKHVDADTTPSTTRKFFVSQYRREGHDGFIEGAAER